MDLLFKNTTQFSADLYSEFLSFHNKTYRFSYHLYTFFISLVLLFCMAGHIVYQNYWLTGIFLLLWLIFLCWRIFRPITLVKKEYEGEKVTKEQEITYLFFDKSFVVHFNNNNQTFYYSNIHRIFETDTFFYFYLDKTYAFIIHKNCFSKR